jgi:hypothetical protein
VIIREQLLWEGDIDRFPPIYHEFDLDKFGKKGEKTKQKKNKLLAAFGVWRLPIVPD